MRQLFKQSNLAPKVSRAKTHFAHCYRDNLAVVGDTPFNVLFSSSGKLPQTQEPDKSSFQQFFDHELSLFHGRPVTTEPNHTYGSATLKGSENGVDLSHESNLSTRFIVLNDYEETLDTKTFRFCRLDGQPFDYLPGQYVTISVEIKGQECKRSYSLASTPTRPGSVEITVKRDQKGGVVSNWLNDNLKEGDILTIKGSFGKFTCARAVPPKILFLAAGSGIVPIMSMLRWLVDTHANTDIVLLLSFRTQYDIIFGEELKLIAARHKNIKLFITLTKEPLIYSNWAGLTGRVNEKMIAACVSDVSERLVYQCGPDAFMTDNKQYLQNLGVPEGQVFCESFTVNSPQVVAQAKTQTSIIGRPPKQISGNYRIRFAKSGKTIVADDGVSLLELAEQSGISIGHECRAGNCGECMVKCLKGKVEMTEQAEIADFDRKKGWVYACCAYPVSNAVLDV